MLASGIIDSSGMISRVKVPDNDVLHLILGDETWEKEEMNISVNGNNSDSYTEVEDGSLEGYSDGFSVSDEISLTESMIKKLISS